MRKDIHPNQVAIYIRWSTDDQGEGTTLAVQREGCKAYLLSQGWQESPDLIFVDDGYSGATLDRPALTRLRRQVQAGAVDCVVVLKLDRLSRNVADMVHLVIEEWGDLCHLKSAREAIDTTNHAGRMFFYTLTSFAEWERATIRERTFAGKLKRAQAGQNPGMKAPYGYTSVGGAFQVVPEEADIVRCIFTQYQAGLGATRIAHELNQQGIPYRSRPGWDKTEVHRVLSRPLYCGDLAFGVRSRNPRHGKQPGQPFWVRNARPLALAEGAVPPIISRELFHQVQARKASRPNPRNQQSGRSLGSDYLLTGLVRCAHCNAALYGRRQSPGGRQYYVCSGRHSSGRAVCNAGHLPMAELDAHVIGLFLRRHGQSATRDRHVSAYLADLDQEQGQIRHRLHQADTRLQRLQEQAARLRREYRAGALTAPELREHLAEITAEESELTGHHRHLQQLLSTLAALPGPAELCARILPQIDPWAILPLPDRKHLLRCFIAQVRAHRPAHSARRAPLICEVIWKAAPEI